MSRNTLTHEMRKELDRLNDRIDKKIVKGQRFDADAKRHKELLAALHRIEGELSPAREKTRKPLRYLKSPVRRSLSRGVFARLLTFQMA
jgi:hypothetical protein